MNILGVIAWNPFTQNSRNARINILYIKVRMLYPNMLYDPHIPNAVNLLCHGLVSVVNPGLQESSPVGFLLGLPHYKPLPYDHPARTCVNPAASRATRAAREKSSNSSPWGMNNLCEVNYMYNYVYSTIWYHISTIMWTKLVIMFIVRSTINLCIYKILGWDMGL